MAGELLERSTSVAITGCSDGPAHAADVATAGGDEDKELAEQQDLVRALPHGVIADVLSRLAPRWLAAARCVCRDWRAAIDTRRLLRADLLPLSTRGIFVHFYYHRFPELLARPSSMGVGAITGSHDFLPNTDTSIKVTDPCITDYDIKDHCNGLLLLNKYVVKPATRRWDPLPPCPPSHDHPVVMHTHDDDYDETTFNEYLAFDPTVSPHYKVFVVPHRISLSNNRYHVISPPVGMRQSMHPTRCLERSENGVYFAALDNYRLKVWILNESSGQSEWTLKLNKDIEPLLPRHCDQQVYKSSMLKDVNFNKVKIEAGENKKVTVKGRLQSTSHDHATKNNRGTVQGWFVPQESFFYNPQVRILGFHLYKEVIFLSEAVEKRRPFSMSVEKGLAYHLFISQYSMCIMVEP
ncbi:hypothetical protein ACQ4PT_063640 [Festuca glaucescens]